MINLASTLERNASLFPDKPALLFGARTTTYGQLNSAAYQVANGLRALGIGQGDKVLLSCPNLPYFPMIYYGILKAGAVVVPVNVLLKGNELVHPLRDSQAKAFFCFEGTQDLPIGAEGHKGFLEAGTCPHFFLITADPGQPSAIAGVPTLGQFLQDQPATSLDPLTDANDTAVIIYTSGTTGRPKGAELSHANLAMNAMVAHSLLRQTSADVHLVVLPLFHCFGQTTQMLAGILAGATLVLLPRFDPDQAFQAMAAHRVTIFVGVPTMYIALLHLPGAAERHDLAAVTAHLRIGASGGSALPVEVIRQFEAAFGIPILEGYGLSETCPVATFSCLDHDRIPGSVGKAVWGVEVRILDAVTGRAALSGADGEVLIRGHNVMKGYYRQPEATAKAIQDGWLHTGDLGHLDDAGNLFIVDRLKDMIIRNGFNVYPRELEEVLMTHPAVAQVAVLGVPHEVHGEEVLAVLVLKPGHTASSESVLGWCKERMAAYKFPRLVAFVTALPMTATGKVLKREIKLDLIAGCNERP